MEGIGWATPQALRAKVLRSVLNGANGLRTSVNVQESDVTIRAGYKELTSKLIEVGP